MADTVGCESCSQDPTKAAQKLHTLRMQVIQYAFSCASKGDVKALKQLLGDPKQKKQNEDQLLIQDAIPELSGHRDLISQTLLMRASAGGHLACVEYLLSLGVDANSVCYDGWTAMHYAARRDRGAVIRALATRSVLVKGKKVAPTSEQVLERVDIRTKYGETPLMIATTYGSTNAVRTLLGLDANPLLTDWLGRSAIDFANQVTNTRGSCLVEGSIFPITMPPASAPEQSTATSSTQSHNTQPEQPKQTKPAASITASADRVLQMAPTIREKGELGLEPHGYVRLQSMTEKEASSLVRSCAKAQKLVMTRAKDIMASTIGPDSQCSDTCVHCGKRMNINSAIVCKPCQWHAYCSVTCKKAARPAHRYICEQMAFVRSGLDVLCDMQAELDERRAAARLLLANHHLARKINAVPRVISFLHQIHQPFTESLVYPLSTMTAQPTSPCLGFLRGMLLNDPWKSNQEPCMETVKQFISPQGEFVIVDLIRSPFVANADKLQWLGVIFQLMARDEVNAELFLQLQSLPSSLANFPNTAFCPPALTHQAQVLIHGLLSLLCRSATRLAAQNVVNDESVDAFHATIAQHVDWQKLVWAAHRIQTSRELLATLCTRGRSNLWLQQQPLATPLIVDCFLESLKEGSQMAWSAALEGLQSVLQVENVCKDSFLPIWLVNGTGPVLLRFTEIVSNAAIATCNTFPVNNHHCITQILHTCFKHQEFLTLFWGTNDVPAEEIVTPSILLELLRDLAESLESNDFPRTLELFRAVLTSSLNHVWRVHSVPARSYDVVNSLHVLSFHAAHHKIRFLPLLMMPQLPASDSSTMRDSDASEATGNGKQATSAGASRGSSKSEANSEATSDEQVMVKTLVSRDSEKGSALDADADDVAVTSLSESADRENDQVLRVDWEVLAAYGVEVMHQETHTSRLPLVLFVPDLMRGRDLLPCVDVEDDELFATQEGDEYLEHVEDVADGGGCTEGHCTCNVRPPLPSTHAAEEDSDSYDDDDGDDDNNDNGDDDDAVEDEDEEVDIVDGVDIIDGVVQRDGRGGEHVFHFEGLDPASLLNAAALHMDPASGSLIDDYVAQLPPHMQTQTREFVRDLLFDRVLQSQLVEGVHAAGSQQVPDALVQQVIADLVMEGGGDQPGRSFLERFPPSAFPSTPFS
eukprot:m.145939 g.145939  ORF g.145939 m.145939 type:complete len:1155 (-) comp14145_c1_seq1:91-3555(-)